MVKSIPTQRTKTSKRQVVKDLTGLEHWTHRGIEDVYYQRESCATWWTILGGVAVAALLTRLETVWGLVRSGDWYYLLYVVTTALVILLAWLQISWGALVVFWRISLDNVMWIYLSGLSLSFVSLSVSNISIWWLALASRSRALLPIMASSNRPSHSYAVRLLVIARLEQPCRAMMNSHMSVDC